MLAVRVAALLLSAAAVAGCSDDAPPGRCMPGTRGGPMGSRTVEIGKLMPFDFGSDAGTLATRFRAFTAGEEATLVHGFQGGYMVLPVVRVTAGDATAPEECFDVAIENSLDMPVDELTTRFQASRELDLVEGHYYSDELLNLLAFDRDMLVGRTLTMRAVVMGDGFTAASDPTTLLLR